MKAQAALFALLAVLLAAGARAESFPSWTSKGDKARKRGDAAEAVEDYTSALRLWLRKDGAKAKAKVLESRGEVLEGQGEDERALEDTEAALAIDGKNARLHHRRGRLLLKAGRGTEAITEFYKATKLDMSLKEAYFDRARAYELQGDGQFAREDYKTACGLKLKKACDKIHPPKAAARAKPGRARDREAGSGGLEVKKTPLKRKYKLDFPACRASMDACAEEGKSFVDCVNDAKVCERGNKKGCCPELCLKEFHRLTDAHGLSDAEAFREVFAAKSPCSRGISTASPASSVPGSKEL